MSGTGRPSTGVEVRGVRLHPDVVKAIDEIAEANLTSRAAVIRYLVARGLARHAR